MEVIKENESLALQKDIPTQDTTQTESSPILPKNKKKKPKKKASGPIEPIPEYYQKALQDYPVSLRNTKAKGRHAAASSPISEGTTVCREQATAFVVRSEFIDQQCHVCLETLATKLMCLDCKKSFYCSQACLDKDTTHPKVCSIMSQVDSIGSSTDTDPDLLRLMVLLMAKRMEEAAKPQEIKEYKPLCSTPYWCVEDLLSHREHADRAFIKVLTEASQRLLSEMPESMAMPVEDMVTLACRINSNAHGLGDNQSRNTDVALGLFPVGAMFFNHACNPNTAFVGMPNGQLAFRTIRPVKTDEELTVSYIDLYASRDERRQDLLKTKHFWCKCKRCTTPMENSVDRFLQSVVCTCCSKDVYVIPPASMEELDKGEKVLGDTWTCAGCGHVASASKVKEAIEKANASYAAGMYALRQKRDYRSACRQLEPLAKTTLPSQAKTLPAGEIHPQNSIRLNASIPLLNCFRHQDNLKGAIEVNRTILGVLDEHSKQSLPDKTAEISDFWQNLGELCDAMAEQCRISGRQPLQKKWYKEARDAYSQAAKVRAIVFGPEHPKTQLVEKFALRV
ncbi:hypothetical protein CLU79DRAFT_728498 [Phycomyces nitens]|nr:hypothetical protein CLU79DRAFT_728498 [Phycomyces nitens]